MNNVELFYERKALLNTFKRNIENRYMFCVINNEGNLHVKLNSDLDDVLGKEDRRVILDIVGDVIRESEPKMRECVIKKLTEFMEYSRKQAREDFELIN